MARAKYKVYLLRLAKEMWPKVTAYALLAIFSAVGAMVLKKYFPLEYFADKISVETVANILNILASSMLAVTTFSLTTMVTAYGAATSVSPRATRLVMEDSTAQNVLATFLGSFLFSLVGLILINLGVYEGNGRFIIFIMTLVVILLIVFTLIRWIDRLTKLGRVGETTKMVEKAAEKALKKRAEMPHMGGRPLTETEWELIGPKLKDVKCLEYGYLQYVDMAALNTVTADHNCDIFILTLPGTYVNLSTVLARVTETVSAEAEKKLRDAFAVADERSFEHDPRFGLCVLAEIADKVLPPALIDSGTVIDVIGRLVRILALYAENIPKEEPEAKYGRIWTPALDIGDMFDDSFSTMIRDAAGLLEIQIRLQKAFKALYDIDQPEYKKCARIFSAKALARAEKSKHLDEEDLKILRRLAYENLS